MFSLLKKTVQPMKILFNKNNNYVIKPSTIKVSSIPNRHLFLIPNKVNINYLRTFHSGLALQGIQRASASKSFSLLPKVRETVVKQYFYPLTKPEMSLVKNRGKTEIPPEEFLACDLMSIIAAGAVVLWILSWSIPSDPMAKLDQLSETIDKKAKTAKIDLEYWTALGETIKDVVAIEKINQISKTDKLSQKVTEELNGRPKEELSPKLAQIQEKMEEIQQEDAALIREALAVFTKYGSNIWSYTEEQKKVTAQKLHQTIPSIKKYRKMIEDVYALTQNLNMEDFCKNDDTETKNDCKCS